MIDFTNKTIVKLKQTDISEGKNAISNLLVKDEEIKFTFVSMRDKLVFTNKRIVSVNVKGVTGKKIDYTSIPYSNIQVFSLESAGALDLDAELDITISGLGTVRFELNAQTDVNILGNYISEKVLN